MSFFKNIIYILFFTITFCYGMNDQDFRDSKNYSYLISIADSDLDKALNIANALFLKADTSREIIEAKMISSVVWYKSGAIDKTLSDAIISLQEASKSDDYYSQAIIQLYLAKRNLDVGYLEMSNLYLDMAEKTILLLPETEAKNYVRVELYLLKGSIFLSEQKFAKSINAIEQADSIINNIISSSNKKNTYLAKLNYQYGAYYFYLEKFSESLHHLDKALNFTTQDEELSDFDLNNIYNAYAEIYLKTKDLKQCSIYLYKSLNVLRNTNYVMGKIHTYTNVINYYNTIKNHDSISHYKSKYIATLSILDSHQNRKLNFEDVFKIEEEEENDVPASFIYFGFSLLALISIGIVYKQNTLLFKNSEKQPSKNDADLELKEPATATAKNNDYLPIDTEVELLSKLDEFEKKKKFLNNNMALNLMASQLQTNNKYLRYILKKHRNTDFNNYINELRISYITNKLKTDPKYLQYKISYLAKESGFSSHSKFTKTFKRINNYSPSEFIQKYRSELSKNQGENFKS
ncbi:helix-turn-helix domain-containing protein [Aequorivita sp. KMM 9714]|uniref:helix-turn-helix domain-containing protein n=1 Tax=Aequorivita sp. KMM 9714 TaxID=2707173 RepID=UPI0013E9A367|nr:helix-turn-helix domain-containing protein [Aequorivita sp. KMM 9714]NGX85320.1 helix-turn-helix domain-containing protein [Aequorivita sp. KMM 9714]